VIVYKDVGGLVSDYEAQTEQYRRENREVRLHECRSACTLALSLPNVCVYPDAQVKFHQAYNEITREADLGVSSKLFASYPLAVQARLGYLTREYRVLSGTELIGLGMRNCNAPGATMIAGARSKTPAATEISSASSGFNPNPWGDLARKVQAAVSTALSGQGQNSPAPIRIAVADRQAIASAPAQTPNSPPPLPPRRPPSLAFTAQDLEPQTAQDLGPQTDQRLIDGAQPILAETQFSRRAMAR
jgi:hypothetical protein